MVCDGPQKGTAVPLRGRTLLIGRAPECDLRLEDAYVSRHHCLLERAGGEWQLRDLGSRNGTWVGERRLERPLVLTPGVVFRVGRTHVLYESASSPEA